MRRPASPLLAHLRSAKDLIDGDYGEPLDLDALARRADCSRYHFLRGFRATYGVTPRAYLTRRIERAKDLLRSTDLSVTEVCYAVGFSSLGSFSARFSELVGVSPSAYRGERGARAIPSCFLMMWTRPAADGEKSAIAEKLANAPPG